MKKLFAIITCVIFFGCASTNDINHYPPIRFNDKAKISFDVAKIEIENKFSPSFTSPNVEHQFPYAPAYVIKDWAQDRLFAKGKDKILRVVILDASVIEKKLPKTEGIKSKFMIDQSELYEAKYNIRLEIIDQDPIFPVAEINISVNRSESIAEDATIADREKLFYEMGKGLAEDFNAEFDANHTNYLAKYIIY
jgi:hypothetical protein